ncbi:hypothetical protein LOS78_07445 [Paracoccus sp. MA]|uniref:hypothetical protein n=1 Tax=Paracoccus sp. MA TaxID=2895796 RepID=UPI001E520195|nr:hypothetical protein [Paracoccus sp. MA]UFM65788.1 hypothetical protein LOS78_07445 [Paracoccus sp. MA]
MLISSLFKPPPLQTAAAQPSLLQGVVNTVDTLVGSLLEPAPAPSSAAGSVGEGGVRFDFSQEVMQAASAAPEAASAPVANPAAPAAAQPAAPADADVPAAATPAAAPVIAEAASGTAAAPALTVPVGAAKAEIPAPAASAVRTAAEAVDADPDAEALARAWAIRAQARESAQGVIDRLVSRDSRPWPTDVVSDSAVRNEARPETLAKL